MKGWSPGDDGGPSATRRGAFCAIIGSAFLTHSLLLEVVRLSIVGRGLVEGCLESGEVARITEEALAALPVDGRRVLVLIPDGTRTMPMPLVFEAIERALDRRVKALDFLVALGTHMPMSDAQLTALIGRRDKPDIIVSDHRTEFTSNAILAWSKDRRVEWHSMPG